LSSAQSSLVLAFLIKAQSPEIIGKSLVVEILELVEIACGRQLLIEFEEINVDCSMAGEAILLALPTIPFWANW
jgi:hypothetical protein